MGTAQIDNPRHHGNDRARHGLAEGDGFLLLGLVAGSWALTLGVGWVVWRVLVF